MVISPLAAAWLTYYLTTKWQSNIESNKIKGLSKALEHEIYHNIFEMIDLDRVAGVIDKYSEKYDVIESPDLESIFDYLEYNKPIYWAFETIVKNAFNSFRDSSTEIFLLYNEIRDYDRRLSKKVAELVGYSGPLETIVFEKMNTIKSLAKELLKTFESEYLQSIEFISVKGWEDYKNRKVLDRGRALPNPQ